MFLAATIKEFKLVFRDLHAVLVLFVMPAIFITIMSLALQDEFAEDREFSLQVYYSVAEKNEYTSEFIGHLRGHEGFRFVEVAAGQSDTITRLPGDDSKAMVAIPADLVDLFQPDLQGVTPVRLWLAPDIDTRTRLLIEAVIYEALARTRLHFTFAPQLSSEMQAGDFIAREALQPVYLYGQEAPGKTPTAVQQNVPAWLIFSMFFVVIPLSTTLITEKQQGTLSRLRTMDVSIGLFLAAKALPYLVINQLQLVGMLLVGVYLVPLLGGDRLVVGDSYGALAAMSLAIGMAAMGYALLVAVIAKTTEQATGIGGVGNILLGAIGGIMVPRFVMPDYLQEFTRISPMSWGLDGFLEIFLYGHGMSAVLGEVAILLAFAAVMLMLALGLFRQQL